jgi:phage tail P2-like protein
MDSPLSTTLLEDILPESIRADPTVTLSATAIDPELQDVTSQIREVILLARLDELPHEVVDLLAWQWHVDHYEPEVLSLEAKRSLVRRSIEMHRRKGTPWAVRQVCEAVFGPTEILEWFRYGGRPYFFRVRTVGRIPGPDAWRALLRGIHEMKNVRSWLDGVEVVRDRRLPLFPGIVTARGGRQILGLSRPEAAPSLLYGGAAVARQGQVRLRPRIGGYAEFAWQGAASVQAGYRRIESLDRPDPVPRTIRLRLPLPVGGAVGTSALVRIGAVVAPQRFGASSGIGILRAGTVRIRQREE